MESMGIIESLRFTANVAENNDKPGISTVCLKAAAEIELWQQRVALLREALALHHSMVLGGEKESPASEACYKIAMESSR
jgi:hypothetical protein